MRLFAISDIHRDYPDNADWVDQVSDADYRNDLLILACDLMPQRARKIVILRSFGRHASHTTGAGQGRSEA